MDSNILLEKMTLLAKAQAIRHYFCVIDASTVEASALAYDAFDEFIGTLDGDQLLDSDYGSVVEIMFGEDDGDPSKKPEHLQMIVWEPHENASAEELFDMVGAMMRGVLRNAAELGLIIFTE